MEVLSNVAWALLSSMLLGLAWLAFRSGRTRLSLRSALLTMFLICGLLLPAISVSDDLLEAHQKALPASMQTWRLASEGASVGFDILPVLCFGLLTLLEYLVEVVNVPSLIPARRRESLWVTRSGRLRPPPFRTI